MKKINPANVLTLLLDDFIDWKPSSTNEEERELAEKLAQILKDAASLRHLGHNTEFELVVDHDESNSVQEDSDDEEKGVNKAFEKDPLSEDQLKQALNYYRSTKSGTRTLASMMKTFRYIKGQHHIRQLLRCEKYTYP